jgi:hypothetical protein
MFVRTAQLGHITETPGRLGCAGLGAAGEQQRRDRKGKHYQEEAHGISVSRKPTLDFQPGTIMLLYSPAMLLTIPAGLENHVVAVQDRLIATAHRARQVMLGEEG